LRIDQASRQATGCYDQADQESIEFIHNRRMAGMSG
jgi:hypothetical protein